MQRHGHRHHAILDQTRSLAMGSKSKKSPRPKKSTSTLPQLDWPLILKIVSAVGAVLLAWVVVAGAVPRSVTPDSEPAYKCGEPSDGFATVFCGKHLMAMKSLDDADLLMVKTSNPSAFDVKVGVVQTKIDLAQKRTLLPVHDHMVEFIADRGPQRILLLGLGGGAIPLMLSQRCPDCEIVAVDLYQDALTIVRKFVLADDGKKIQYVRADAQRYIADAATESFDVVIGDIFQGAYLPEFVFDDAFIGDVRRVMRDDAAYIINVFAPEGATDRFIRMYMALRKAFPSVDLGDPAGSKSSFVFTASKIEPPEPEVDAAEGTLDAPEKSPGNVPSASEQ